MDLLTAIEKGWPYVVVGAPGAWAVVTRWLDGRKTKRGQRAADALAEAHAERARAEIFKLAQEAARGVIETLREEAKRLEDRLAAIEEELQALQRQHNKMMADKDARIATLEGEKRQLETMVAILERALVEAGGHVPMTMKGHFEIAGDPPVAKSTASLIEDQKQ